MFEILALFFSLTALSFYLLFDYYRDRWRDERLGRKLVRLLNALQGKPVASAIEQLGDPSEILEGASGRRLYIWNSHRAPRLPKDKEFVVVSLTVDEQGTVIRSSWKA
jgi:hypothetical protein